MALPARAPDHRPTRYRGRSLITLMAVAVAVAATPSPAAAVDNNREDATKAVSSAVAVAYKSWMTKGRTIRVQCAGTRNVFNCSWWIIRGKFGRKATTAALPLPLSAMASEVNGVKPGTVALSGFAQASWTCQATGRKGRCTRWGFNITFG